jgi:hypothetical protein
VQTTEANRRNKSMWTIESGDLGYSLYKDGAKKADLYGFYYEWKPIVELLNKFENSGTRIDALINLVKENAAEQCA